MPSRRLFRTGYVAFLYRFYLGFVEHDPSRSRKRKRRPRKPSKKRINIRASLGSRSRTRVRTTPLQRTLKPGGLWQFANGAWFQATNPTVTLSGPYAMIEHTQDFKNPGPPYRTGGNFTSVKVELNPLRINGIGQYKSPTTVNLGVGFPGAWPIKYQGGFHTPDFSQVDFTDAQYADVKFIIGPVSGIVPSMLAYHPLVDSLRPKLNHASTGQTLAEISQVPRMLQNSARDFHDAWRFAGGSPSTKLMSPKGAADSFLGVQFGWFPFINDIRDICDLVNNYDEILGRRTSKNDRWDHRERVLHEETEENILAQGDGMKCQPNAWWLDTLLTPSGGWTKRFTYTERDSHRVWASGDYKFYRPEFDMSKSDYGSGLNQIRRVSTLLGTNMSPSLLWKVTPWTWLADWFGNVGRIIDSVSAAGLDGVVSKNVFLMMSRRREIVLTQALNMASGPIGFDFRRVITSKQRGHALTPYQFSLLPGDLSAKQWSILGALGLSKFT